MAIVSSDQVETVPAAEVPEVELYHAHSWVTKYLFSQDAKVIAIQYSFTALAIGLLGLVLSWVMRLQLGFPEIFTFIAPADYYQFITMHGSLCLLNIAFTFSRCAVMVVSYKDICTSLSDVVTSLTLPF